MAANSAYALQTAMSGLGSHWPDGFDIIHFSRTVLVYYGLPEARIRNASPADFPRLAELQVKALLASSRDTLGALRIKRYVERHLRQTLMLCQAPHFYVAEIDDEVVASGGWTTVEARSGEWMTCAVGFFTDPAFARRGLGRSLLAVTEATARHAGIETLTAFAPLDGARLFQRAGWRAGIVTGVDLGAGASIDLIAVRKQL